ncbi:alpha/beta hydrolase family esterase [Larkinella sp. VNQ87]|uniref:alpha/beta hydrolase family esterase n=1 Tax=Larkinella sp. VNQ87 TaxID=3400921 RepID=UPI003C0ACE0E
MIHVIRWCLLVLLSGMGACRDRNEPPEDRKYRFTGSLSVGGRERTFVLQLPADYYDKTADFALVIGLHGFGGNALQFEKDYLFTQKANQASFVVVYPEAVPSDGPLGLRTWNAGACCGYAEENQIDDIGFIRNLIDRLGADYRIDPKRVYVTGMSNGGMMAYRLACELSDKIAAVAAVSSTMIVAKPCRPGRAVPLLHIHSVRDTIVPYQGGIGLGGYRFPPVDSVLSVWAGLNACRPAPVTRVDNAGYSLREWTDCAPKSVIQAYLTKDGGHSWPGGQKARPQADEPSSAIQATDIIWDFFTRYQLP